MAQPGQTPKGEPQRRTHIFNVRDPEVAGSKTPVSETPAPGTSDVGGILMPETRVFSLIALRSQLPFFLVAKCWRVVSLVSVGED